MRYARGRGGPAMAAAAAVAVVCGACPPARAAGAARPNVLFIALDDMNDWIGPLGGHPQAKTPNLDRLAKCGTTFVNAHTAAAACHPSRVAIMTGVRPTTTGITRNVFNKTPGPSWRAHPRLKDVPTLSQFFRDRGYYAAGGGKIYHALQWGPWSENDPDTWDEFFPRWDAPIPTQVRPPEAYFETEPLFGDRPLGKRKLFGWQPLPVPDEAMADYRVVDWAIGELNKVRDRPLFLACGIFRPHIPWEVPQKYFDLYPLATVQLPVCRVNDLEDAWHHGRRDWHQWVVQNGQWKAAVQGYLASISFADAQVGRLLDGLDASPRRGDTVVVLWSDHGMHIGEKENWEKFTCWEESTRVPLFFAGPGVAAGARCDAPVSLLDVYPTLAELAGIPPPPHVEGESLAPLLKDASAPRLQPAITAYDDFAAVRTRRWRYIYYPSTGLEELYDHMADPGEYDNLAYRPDRRLAVEEHRALLRRYTPLRPPEGDAPPAGYAQGEDGRIRREGYVPVARAVERARAAHKAGQSVPKIRPDGTFRAGP